MSTKRPWHGDPLRHAAVAAGDLHLGEPAVDGSGAGHRGPVADLHVTGGAQLGDEVLGHAGGDVRAAHEQGDVGGVLREVQRGLPGGVAATDDVHRAPVIARASVTAAP